MGMIRQWLGRFLAGRYGMDPLNTAMLTLCLVLEVLVLALMLVILFRMFSRNLDRRRAENAKFLQLARPICRRFKSCRARMQDREHRYFKCPNCGQQMRVPRGKGRITVHCRTCGATFEEKC